MARPFVNKIKKIAAWGLVPRGPLSVLMTLTVGHHGRVLFPMMPYQDFRNFTDEDLASVVLYLRSLQPIHNPLPKMQIPFPLSPLINGVSQPVSRSRQTLAAQYRAAAIWRPSDTASTAIRRKTNSVNHYPAWNWPVAKSLVRLWSARILPPIPAASRINDEKLFISTLRTGHVGARALNSPMRWWFFKNMTDDDLKAIFAYLKTVKPVHHRVDNSETAGECRRCNHKPGGSEAGAYGNMHLDRADS